MKQQLATYAIQLAGYFIITYGMASGVGRSWSRRTWSQIDTLTFALGAITRIVVAFFAFEAVANTTQGLPFYEGLFVETTLKLWIIALVPLFMTVMFGVELAKRQIKFRGSEA